MDGKMGWMDGWMVVGWIYRWKDGVNGWMVGLVDGRMG
jgi:hypothetical protein